MTPLPGSIQERRAEYETRFVANQEAHARCGAVNVTPLPSQVSPEYAELHSQLCTAARLARNSAFQMSHIIGSRDHQLSVMGGAPYCVKAAGLLGAVIAEAEAEMHKHHATEKELEAKLDALFAEWCKAKGMLPGEFIELKASY